MVNWKSVSVTTIFKKNIFLYIKFYLDTFVTVGQSRSHIWLFEGRIILIYEHVVVGSIIKSRRERSQNPKRNLRRRTERGRALSAEDKLSFVLQMKD